MEILNTRMFQFNSNIASGLAKHMDVIILNNNCVIYNKPLNSAKTIFINTRFRNKLIIYFIEKILPELEHKVNVIIAGEDYTFPNNVDLRMKTKNNRLDEFKNLGKHEMINKIFVENLDENIENAIPIPLGINPKECSTKSTYFLKYESIHEKKELKFTNFNRKRDGRGQWKERNDVENLCKTYWKENYIECSHESHSNYLKKIGLYAFTICVRGGGLDVNPKLWEALMIGVIPIIRENKPYTDIYLRLDLPVVIVEKWDVDTINDEKLNLWYNKYYNYFTHEYKRKKMLEILSLDYWVGYVKKFE